MTPSRRNEFVRKVLLVAFHFPPIAASSGLQRTLRFAQYLPEFGWKPLVLTVGPPMIRAEALRSEDQIPPDCEVFRAPCIDVARHLSLRGRYPRWLALPDQWASWQWTALPIVRRVAREWGIDAVWSTYPIATAHIIGCRAAHSLRVPWVADFRDPMAQENYPPDPRKKKAFERIEASVAANASRMVFVTPSAQKLYRERFRAIPTERLVLLENGYDETIFEGLSHPKNRANEVPVLLHSGIVYPEERNPAALFEALGSLSQSGAIRAGDFVVRFRAPVHGAMLHTLAQRHRVESFVQILPRLSYREALEEMLAADALVIMQGANCNEQIPAKLYEYLRAQKPILPLVDPLGDTGAVVSVLGYPFVTKLESRAEIERNLPLFLASLRAGALPVADERAIVRYSRRALTRRLADILDAAVDERNAALGGHTRGPARYSVARNQIPDRYVG